jgi:hypothetical protein
MLPVGNLNCYRIVDQVGFRGFWLMKINAATAARWQNATQSLKFQLWRYLLQKRPRVNSPGPSVLPAKSLLLPTLAMEPSAGPVARRLREAERGAMQARVMPWPPVSGPALPASHSISVNRIPAG